MREWECLNCGAKHDRDHNAAINILVAGGQSETLNGRGGKHKTTVKVAAACVSGALRSAKRQPTEELRLSRNLRAFRPERMSNIYASMIFSILNHPL
ncbi:zinc ribbon domain-containing protein [Okeania sp. SIO3B5]|uniref:zinc ribbon domain-containing protein n=1 Tax=Okeania sp. SIO3B5 TaxID=2607811 RepID=UPI0025D9D586|nr:zinc ribbon domain-containing protein [Okeania sp. SIO3B5]